MKSWKSFLPTRNITKKYILDWIVNAVVLTTTLLIDRLDPFEREFSLSDKTISHEYKAEQTVSEVVAGIISFLLPSLVIIIWSAYERSPRSLHHGLLGIVLSTSLTLLIVVVIKIGVGRHRPDWLSRCIPKIINGVYPSDPPGGLSKLSICTQTDKHILKDGQRSFISGHSGTAFSGLFYLTLFLAGKLGLFDRKGHTFKPFLVIAPSVLSMAIAITRIRDNRHHWQDVLVGSLVGCVFAIFSYLQYFYSPYSLKCFMPYECRTDTKVHAQDINFISEPIDSVRVDHHL